MVHAYHYGPYGTYKIRNSDKTYIRISGSCIVHCESVRMGSRTQREIQGKRERVCVLEGKGVIAVC